MKTAINTRKIVVPLIIALSLLFGRAFGQSSKNTGRADTLTSPHSIYNDPNQPYYHYSNNNPAKKKKAVDSANVKLTQAQINKIVGKDTKLGNDAQGHQLYRDANGNKYYLSPTGAKVYVK